MPSTASSFSESAALSAASRNRQNDARPTWLRWAVAGALLAIAVQLVMMAQLAQHQVQRGVQLRQAIAAERDDPAGQLRSALPLSTASAVQQEVGEGALLVQASH